MNPLLVNNNAAQCIEESQQKYDEQFQVCMERFDCSIDQSFQFNVERWQTATIKEIIAIRDPDVNITAENLEFASQVLYYLAGRLRREAICE